MSGQQVQHFKANEMIFREADAADCAFLIERGHVRVFLDNEGEEIELRVLGEGEVFGEMALIDNSLRSASCRALTDCHLIVVTKSQLLERVQSADPVVRLLMRVLFERLRSHNDLLRGKPASTLHKTDPLDLEKRAALERIGLENRIATGLDENEFLPFYQPIYDLETGEIKGCEALLRWLSKEHGVVPPGVFMDIMEGSTLILRAGQNMIAACMRDLALMRTTFSHAKEFFISINVSGRQFADPGFLSVLEQCRSQYQVNSNHIKLELTERVMMEGPHALINLKKCRDLGYQIAVDDFGTGFSSLQYLAQMPLTDLKIDRSFVVGILDDAKSLSIIKSLIYMADLLGLRLIAEGIETPAQRDLLRQLKVQMGQGWLFSKALPGEEFLKLAAKVEIKTGPLKC
jgi:EAL domain-containing protein (putative c-di-GMP-specific phosphodiesterase class I)